MPVWQNAFMQESVLVSFAILNTNWEARNTSASTIPSSPRSWNWRMTSARTFEVEPEQVRADTSRQVAEAVGEIH
ncbi:MAG: hypothetical protein M3P18_07860 [Actinomycetota bacterium]|nr:hypothetical protein [Actinomycetota bacterium]